MPFSEMKLVQMSYRQQDACPSSCQVILSVPCPEICLSLLIFLLNGLLPFFLPPSLFFFSPPFPEHFDVLSEYSYMK